MHRPCLSAFAAACLFIAPHPADAQQPAELPPARRPAAVEELVRRYHEAGDFNGSVLAATGDEIVFRGAYGLASREHGISNRPETVFRLASLTKQFTAAAALKLVRAGRLDLHEPVRRWIPELDSASWHPVTLHHLLSHTAGVPRDLEVLAGKDIGDHFDMSEMIALLATRPPEFAAGGAYRYSNGGYVLVAAVIERVTGSPYGIVMRELLFEPLGLDRTGHEERNMVVPDFAAGYVNLPDRVLRAEYEDKSYVTGAGSLYSNVDDLFSWMRALASGSVLGDSLTSVLLERKVDSGYAYGWNEFRYSAAAGSTGTDQAAYAAVSHSGASPGFSTNLRWYRGHDVTVIVLSNEDRAPAARLANAIGNVLLGIADTAVDAVAGDALIRVAIADGSEAAWARWRATAGTAPDSLPSERRINAVGYRYLAAGLAAEAITIMELQVRAFPESANARDSLGEAYLEAGRRTEAIQAYQEAVRLDPELQSARRALARLENPATGST